MSQDSACFRIVCGVDFTAAAQEAVREAVALAQRMVWSELHFVHALDRSTPSDALTAQRTEEAALNKLEDYVQSVLFDQDISLSTLQAVFHVRWEDPAQALISVAREDEADLIVVGPSERVKLHQFWHRTGVRAFVQRAPVPVLVAHARERAAEDTSHHALGGSGVYAMPARISTPPVPRDSAMDGDSSSSLYCMYEARASQPPPPPPSSHSSEGDGNAPAQRSTTGT